MIPASPGSRASADPVIHFIFYSNPDGYPPVINSARLLARSGYRIEIWGWGEPRGVHYPDNVCIHRLTLLRSSSVARYVAFVSLVLRSVTTSTRLFVGHDMHGLLPARILATRCRVPLIYHCHDFANDGRRSPLGTSLVRAFERRYARTADVVIVPDRERGDVMAEQLRLKRRPLVVANAPLPPGPAHSDKLRQILAGQGYQFSQILLRQGVIGPGHALEATLRSMPSWLDRHWGFVLLGPGEPAYLESLRRLAAELDVASQFAILPPVSYDEVLSFTTGADAGHALYEPIHVNNLYITTASNKIMEYMAAGLPLLVSDRPGLRALVQQRACGVPADEASPESIAVAVNGLLGDAERMQCLAQAAARAFDEEFNYEYQFEPVLSAVRCLISQPGGKAR